MPASLLFKTHSLNMASVINSLDAALDMQAVDSAMFFDTAYIGYKLEDHEQAASLFVPRSELTGFDYDEVVHFVDMYTPAQYYVTLAVVTVSQKERLKDNGILLCKLVHTHWCLTTTPNNDQRGGELRSRRIANSELEHAMVHFSLKCARPGCKGDLKVCSACNDARYCSKRCQVANRASHRDKCKELKAAKRAAKEFLRQHASS
jgi:MYND finger